MAAMRSWAKAVYLAARPYQAPTAAPLPRRMLSVAASSQRRFSACRRAFMSGPDACAARAGGAAGAAAFCFAALARPLLRTASADLAADSGSCGFIATLQGANHKDTETAKERISDCAALQFSLLSSLCLCVSVVQPLQRAAGGGSAC